MAEISTQGLWSQTPRTIVYQNADFVSAMLQEIYQVGLIQSLESDSSGKNSETGNKQRKTSADANTEGSVPLLSKAGGKLDGEWIRQQTEADERSSAQRQKFVFSQAHYLDAVHRGLAERSQIASDAFTASVGDIVEFTEPFSTCRSGSSGAWLCGCRRRAGEPVTCAAVVRAVALQPSRSPDAEARWSG
ncbi:hypothetical protein [Pseudonocardia sp. HH130630-07]|uniref:hypothetical protein n=1 Tax=Pseudonocardia sp. HH130630-07 TaxID=1690815 RepID=UPI0012E99D16|nr:hypothetical protein [Pseudonocardia sp. HH130630-07]